MVPYSTNGTDKAGLCGQLGEMRQGLLEGKRVKLKPVAVDRSPGWSDTG